MQRFKVNTIEITLGERVKLNATGVEFTLKFQEEHKDKNL